MKKGILFSLLMCLLIFSMAIASYATDTNDCITVVSVYAKDDIFADSIGTTLEIEIYGDSLLDARAHLKLFVENDDGEIVARQTGVYYHYDNTLVYQMEIIGDLTSGDSSYYIKYEYDGKYTVDFPDYSRIYVKWDAGIKDVEIVDTDNNTFIVTLANAEPGDEFILKYEDEYEQTITKSVTVGANKTISVTFGSDIEYYEYNYLRLYDTEECFLDSCCLCDYTGDEDDLDYRTEDYGISYDEYVSPNTNAWVYVGQKAFGQEAGYTKDELEKVKIYYFDMTLGRAISSEIERYDYYDEDHAGAFYIKFKESMDPTHEYKLVVNDGYSLRTFDDFVVTLEPMIEGISVYDSNKNYLYQNSSLPTGIKSLYVAVQAFNVPTTGNNVKVELIDALGKTLATVNCRPSYLQSITLSTGLTAGEYKLKASYSGASFTKTFNVGAHTTSAAVYQWVADECVYDGKTYIIAEIEGRTLNPENLNYKIMLSDGSTKNARYHKSLYGDGYYKYFVVVVDEDLSSLIDYRNTATFQVYNGSELVAPTYPGNVKIYNLSIHTNPFVYSIVDNTGDTIKLFGEGFTSSKTVTITMYDDVTKTGVSVDSVQNNNGTIVFNKSDLNKINVYAPLMVYLYRDAFVEVDGDFCTRLYGFADYVNVILKDSFGFAKEFGSDQYEVLNLPHVTYGYYKLASTPEALTSLSYQPIEVGLLYKLENVSGKQTLYAQFKTRDGVESGVYSTSISVDLAGPEILVENIPSKIVVEESNSFMLSPNFTTNEDATFKFALYDSDNKVIGSTYSVPIAAGSMQMGFNYTMGGSYDYTKAAKIVVYAIDTAGNRSANVEIPISIVEKYTRYNVEGGYILLNNETAIIEKVETTAEKVSVPSKINNAEVKGIGDNAFETCDNLTTISIPDSIESISENAFTGVTVTLKVKENSAAHSFATENGFTFEIVTVNPGDANGDDVINMKDALILRKHLAGWEVEAEEAALDVNGDGSINMKDALILRKFLAGWEVTLG